MNQKSSLREVPQFVSGVLTGNIYEAPRGGVLAKQGRCQETCGQLKKRGHIGPAFSFLEIA